MTPLGGFVGNFATMEQFCYRGIPSWYGPVSQFSLLPLPSRGALASPAASAPLCCPSAPPAEWLRAGQHCLTTQVTESEAHARREQRSSILWDLDACDSTTAFLERDAGCQAPPTGSAPPPTAGAGTPTQVASRCLYMHLLATAPNLGPFSPSCRYGKLRQPPKLTKLKAHER